MYILNIKVSNFKINIKKEELNKILNSYFFDENKEEIFLLDYGKNFLKVCIYSQNSLNHILKKITEIQLLKNNLEIKNNNLEIKELKIEKEKSWDSSIRIKFLTPTFFKVGSSFKDDLSLYLLFKWLIKRYNSTFDENIKLDLEIIKNIKIIKKELIKREVTINNYKINGFVGEVFLDISNLSIENKKIVSKLLNFGAYYNIGYKNDKGYGKIELI